MKVSFIRRIGTVWSLSIILILILTLVVHIYTFNMYAHDVIHIKNFANPVTWHIT